ncbi:MAG: pyridoxamine 5'-phosphate oxidase family protein [Tepidiformaceae bacterium]
MSLSMSRSEREAFLEGVHIAVVSVQEPGRGPLTAPIWYHYEPGADVYMVLGKDSRKANLLHASGRMSLCVQEEAPPYRYVSIEGPVTLGTPDYNRDTRDMAHRYLGREAGDAYLAGTGGGEGNLLARLTPERWLTVDYGKMGRPE